MKQFFKNKRVKRAVISLFVAVVAFGGWYGYTLYSAIAQATGNKNPLQIVSAFTPVDLKQTEGRTNILLAGYSADDTGHSGAELTDSIMILSIDQTDHSAVVISVPRDLYVYIDGHGYSKINAAYEYGEQDDFSESGYASGGMGLLEKTIETSLGVHSNYEALINYSAVKQLVDTVGGVTVNVQSTNANGFYDPNTDLKLANGVTTLDGQTALNFMRARGEGKGSYGFTQGDFTRTQNQQAVLLALAAKLSGGLSLTKVASYVSILGNNVRTDVQLNELQTLYKQLKSNDSSDYQTVTLNNVSGTSLLKNYTTASGQSALVPIDGVDEFTGVQDALNALLYPDSE
jgi:polyisoprenyl-teichoic acid--peptidoglycan teichoic acid transferase